MGGKDTAGNAGVRRGNAVLTMGSLFDGIGGFPLAAVHNGITPVWASEIEPFGIKVTKIRFPGMKHVGDITLLEGGKLVPVDVICGGSPCQDLSVAGKRRGLAGERSGLFMEQIRIVKEMRDADGKRGISDYLVRPRYLVWENVPGAFSSTQGEDFRAVLEEIIRIKAGDCHVPRPDSGGWKPAGIAILGNGFSLAWRVLDAQYWGVPQRRKRIFLVADFGGLTAPEILFKPESLSGDSAQGRGEGEKTPGRTERSTSETGRACVIPGGGQTTDRLQLLCLNDQGGERMDIMYEVSGTLRAGMGGHPPIVLTGRPESTLGDRQALFDNHRIDARYTGPLPVAPTISASYGTGGNNVPFVMKDAECYCITGNAVGRSPENGGNGFGCQADLAYTLTSTDRHTVFSCQRSDLYKNSNVASTQTARQCKGAVDLVRQPYQKSVGTIGYSDYKGINSQYVSDDKCIIDTLDLVRRLTPLECERLQGFPDGWTDIPGASDSARYKALGNSVAIPCVDFVLHGIAYFLRKNRTD